VNSARNRAVLFDNVEEFNRKKYETEIEDLKRRLRDIEHPFIPNPELKKIDAVNRELVPPLVVERLTEVVTLCVLAPEEVPEILLISAPEVVTQKVVKKNFRDRSLEERIEHLNEGMKEVARNQVEKGLLDLDKTIFYGEDSYSYIERNYSSREILEQGFIEAGIIVMEDIVDDISDSELIRFCAEKLLKEGKAYFRKKN